MEDRRMVIDFEDIPLEEARKMGRGPRMDPILYNALKSKISSLAHSAARMNLPTGVSPVTMKNRILRVATELRVPVTVRRVPGGLLFWRSTDEDIKQAKEVAARLQAAQQRRSWIAPWSQAKGISVVQCMCTTPRRGVGLSAVASSSRLCDHDSVDSSGVGDK